MIIVNSKDLNKHVGKYIEIATCDDDPERDFVKIKEVDQATATFSFIDSSGKEYKACFDDCNPDVKVYDEQELKDKGILT